MGSLVQVWSEMDPRQFSANKRYRSNNVLPSDVRNAINGLAAEIAGEVHAQAFQPGPCHSLRMYLSYPDRRSDLDGPSKRIIDAIQRGVRLAGHKKFNDNSIDGIEIYRRKGDPRITISLLALQEDHCFELR